MSSKRAVRRRSCAGKVRFENEEQAQAVRRHAEREFGSVQEVYRCRFCLGYHLGHRHRGPGQPDSKKVSPRQWQANQRRRT